MRGEEMKVVISDFPDVMGRDLAYEKQVLEQGLKGCQVEIYCYKDKEEFITIMEDADALLTAFLPIDKEVLSRARKLKCIGYNATGYDSTDFEEATKRNIAIIPIAEYCTQEVAEHTISLILALARGIKHYTYDIEQRNTWRYYSGQPLRRIEGQKMGIFGFGKIGRAVAKRALGFGMYIKVYDKSIDEEKARELGVQIATPDDIFSSCDIITNHMSQTPDNYHFFNKSAFKNMKKKPIFINVSRGSSVDEEALIEALDHGDLFGAGLDVLAEEKPDLASCKLKNRENVIITPHAAFYSETSIKDLQTLSCQNVVHYLKGEYEKVHRVVNKVQR